MRDKKQLEQEKMKRAQQEDFGNDYYRQAPKMGKHKSVILQKFTQGIPYFVVIAACILFYFALLRLPSISDTLFKILKVLKPVIYGCGIAYLLNPVVNHLETTFYPFIEGRVHDTGKAGKYSRACSIAVSIMLLIAVVVTLVNMLLPQLYSSIRDMIFTLPGQMNSLIVRINEFTKGDSAAGEFIKEALNEAVNYLQNWLRTDLLTQVNELMSNLTDGVIKVVVEIMNAILGVIISVYILNSKERFSKQSKRIVYALFSPDRANMILHITNKTNEIFGGFIIGKIIDSAIIGCICFVGMGLLKLPYVTLISVIVGVTNVIPFFGPYIGAVPCTLLLLLNNPVQALYFVIFILILQQIDGNIIGPKILGSSTGLSPFWVVVAILVSGGMFGFVGMLVGVPVFGVFFYILQLIINGKLEKKNLPKEYEAYGVKSYVDENGIYRTGLHGQNKERTKEEE